MLNDIEIYILLFFSYSFTGWMMEVVVKFIQFKKFINRGFLIGPYCPIYGWGAVLITLLLKKYYDDPLALFVFGMLVCAILEYFTSYIMEKLFNARWWDYSQKKFNINGRICLDTMIPFGLLGMLITYIINPFLLYVYNKINPNVLFIITIIMILLYIVDNIVSIRVLQSIKKDISLFEKDNTEEISTKVKEVLTNINWRKRRVLLAYPDVKKIFEKIKEKHETAKISIKTKILIKKNHKSKNL